MFGHSSCLYVCHAARGGADTRDFGCVPALYSFAAGVLLRVMFFPPTVLFTLVESRCKGVVTMGVVTYKATGKKNKPTGDLTAGEEECGSSLTPDEKKGAASN